MRQTDKQIDSDDPKIPSLPDDFRKKAVIVFGGKERETVKQHTAGGTRSVIKVLFILFQKILLLIIHCLAAQQQ